MSYLSKSEPVVKKRVVQNKSKATRGLTKMRMQAVSDSEDDEEEEEEQKLSPRPPSSQSRTQEENAKDTTPAQKKSTIVIQKKSAAAAAPHASSKSSSSRINSASNKQPAADDISNLSHSHNTNKIALAAAASPVTSVPFSSSDPNQLSAIELYTQCIETVQGDPTTSSRVARMREDASLALYLLTESPIELLHEPSPIHPLVKVLQLTASLISVSTRDHSLTNQLIALAFELTRLTIVRENVPAKDHPDTILKQCSNYIKRLLRSTAASTWSYLKLHLMNNIISSSLDHPPDSTPQWDKSIAQSIRDLMHPHLRNACTEYSDQFRAMQDARKDIRLITAMCYIDSRWMTFVDIVKIMSLPSSGVSTGYDLATTWSVHSVLLGRMLLELARCDGTPRPEAMSHTQRAFLSKCILRWNCETKDGLREIQEELEGSIYADLVTPNDFASGARGFLSGSQFGSYLEVLGDNEKLICERKISIIFDLLECHGASQSPQRVSARFDYDTLATLTDCILERIINEKQSSIIDTIVDRYSTTTNGVRDLLDAAWYRNRGAIVEKTSQYVELTGERPQGLGGTARFVQEMKKMNIQSVLLKDVERILEVTNAMRGRDVVRPLLEEMNSIPTPLSQLEQYIRELEVEVKADKTRLPVLFPYTLNEAICEAASLKRPLLIAVMPLNRTLAQVQKLVRLSDDIDAKFVTWLVPDECQEEKRSVLTYMSGHTRFSIMHGSCKVFEFDKLSMSIFAHSIKQLEWNPIEIDRTEPGSQLIDMNKKATREEWMKSAAEWKEPLAPFGPPASTSILGNDDAKSTLRASSTDRSDRPQSSSTSKRPTQEENENENEEVTADGLFSEEASPIDLKEKADEQVAIVVPPEETSNSDTKPAEEKKENEDNTAKKEKKIEEEEDEPDEDEEAKLEQRIKKKLNESQPDTDNVAGTGGPAIDDRPTGDDKLSHGKYAEKLAEVLCSPRTQPPITVGVYAQWGGGKSFFLEKLKSFLLSKLDTQNVLWQESQDEELRRQDELRAQDIGTEEANQVYRRKWSWLINKKREAKRKRKGKDNNQEEEDDDEEKMTESDPLAEAQPTSWWHRFRPNYTKLRTDDTNVAIDTKSTQRPPQPVPRLVRFAKKIGLQYTAMKAIMRIWKVMPRANRDVDSIKPLPVRMKFIEFNSWLYSGSDCLWAAFASHLFEQTEEHFGSLTTRIYRARYNDAFGKLSKTLLITVVIIFGLIVAAGICVWKRVGPFAVSDGEDDSDVRTKTFAGLGSAFAFAFLGLLASSRDVISNLIRSQADEVLRTMDRPDFSSRMGFMNSIKTEIDIISSLMRHGEFYDDETGEEYRSQFVIFIDDLDRCPADKVVEVLKALVLLFSSPNAPFIAVLAIDPRLIVQAIETVHAIGGHNRGTQGPGGSAEAMVNGYEYLDKIVQLPFCFPDLQATDKHRLLNSFLPLDQNLKEAAQQSDYREVATLIMKSFLGNPQVYREELKGCIHQQLNEWLRDKAVGYIDIAVLRFTRENPLSKKENAEYIKYLTAKKDKEHAAINARPSKIRKQSHASDSESEFRSLFSILISLVTSPESRFSVADHLKSHPTITFAQLEKRVKRELKQVLEKTGKKYREGYSQEKMQSIARWKDEIKHARRQARMIAAQEVQHSQVNKKQDAPEEQKFRKLREQIRAVLSSPQVDAFFAGSDVDKPPESLHPQFSSIYVSFNSLLTNSSGINSEFLPSVIALRNDIRVFELASSVHPRLLLTRIDPETENSPTIFGALVIPLVEQFTASFKQMDDIGPKLAQFQELTRNILEMISSCIRATMQEDSMKWMRETERAVNGADEKEAEEKNGQEEEMEEQVAETFFPVQEAEVPQLVASPTIVESNTNDPIASPSDPPVESLAASLISPDTASLNKKQAWDTALNVDLLATDTLDTTPAPLTASSVIITPSSGDALLRSTPEPHPFAVPTPDVPPGEPNYVPSGQVAALLKMTEQITKVAAQIAAGADVTETLSLIEKYSSSNLKELSKLGSTVAQEKKTNDLAPVLAVQEEKSSDNVNLAESVAAFNAKPRPKRKILPRQVILDYGAINHKQFTGGWIDIQGQGVANDYARFVSPSKAHHYEPFLSVALAGSIYPYSPEGQFEWDEESKSVRISTSVAPLPPVIYDHSYFIGNEGGWVQYESAFGMSTKYARYILNDGKRIFTVASTNLTTHSQQYQFIGTTETMIGHGDSFLDGTWWNAQDQAWYEWRIRMEGSDDSERSVRLFECFRISAAGDSSSSDNVPGEARYFAFNFIDSHQLVILGDPHLSEMRELASKIGKKYTRAEMIRVLKKNQHAYLYNLKHVKEVLQPIQMQNKAGESNAKTWYRRGIQLPAYSKSILEPTTSKMPYKQRTNVVTIENEANSAQEIWITAMYSYAKCTNQVGIKSKDAPAALPDYSFTLTATLMSAQDHILDRRIMRGVFLPASTPAGHADLTCWLTVSCVFRPDELIAPHIPTAKIRLEEVCTRAGTEVKDIAMMVRPQVLGFTSLPQTREELWRRVEQKIKIENAKRLSKQGRFLQAIMHDANEANLLDRAAIIEQLKGTDAILTHLMKTRTLPHYRTTEWAVNESNFLSRQPSSLLDQVILPSEITQIHDALMPIWIELACWVSNPLSNCPEWNSLRTARTHTLDVSKPLSVLYHVPAKNEKKYDTMEESLRSFAWHFDPELRSDMSLDPHECVAVLKKCVSSWILRTLYNEYYDGLHNTDRCTAIRELQYQAPLSVPRNGSAESMLEPVSSTGAIYTTLCQAHLCQLYLLAPQVMPLFEWFSEAVQHGLDKRNIECAIAGNMRFIQYPCVKLLSHYASDQRFVEEAQKWQENLVMMKAIPEIWNDLNSRSAEEHDESSASLPKLVRLSDVTVYDWLSQLESMLLHEEPKTDDMKFHFFKDLRDYPPFRTYFPQILEVIEKKWNELNLQIQAKEEEDDEKAQAGFSMMPEEISAIGDAAPFLDGNPRRIKRIMNIYNVSRLLVERKRHQHHYRDECTHSFCQQYNADKKSNRSNADSLAASLAFNPLASEMSLHSVFHPPRLTYSLVRPGLFRFILLLEQWPYRTAWLLHIISQSSKKWKHAQEAIDRVHQTKVDLQKREKRKDGNSGASNKDKQVDPFSSSSSAPPTAIDTIPIDAAMSCGMFPPSMSLLELYRFVQPLIYGHRQPRNYEATALDTKGRNGNSTLNANQLVPHNHHNHHHHHAAPAAAAKSKFRTLQNVMKAANAFRSLDEDEELHQELIASPVRPSSAAVVIPSNNNNNSDLHPAFGVVNKSDFDSSVRRHVHDTEGLLAMDSDPDNFALFLALPLDESKDALDPYDIDLQVDDMTQVGDDNDGEEDAGDGGTEHDLLLSALHSIGGSPIVGRSRPQTANRNGGGGGVNFASMKTSSSSAAHTSLLSPSLMHICDLADLSYLAFNLNPALKRQVAILADLTAAYQPIETLLHQYVLKKYAPQQRGQSRGVSRPRSAHSHGVKLHPPSIAILHPIPSSSSSSSSSSAATTTVTSKPSVGSGLARVISRVKTTQQRKSDVLEEKEAHDTPLSPSSSSSSFPMSPFSPAVSDAIKVLPRPPSSQRITATTFQRVTSRTSH